MTEEKIVDLKTWCDKQIDPRYMYTGFYDNQSASCFLRADKPPPQISTNRFVLVWDKKFITADLQTPKSNSL